MAELPSPLDLALLPVGGWGPWLRGEHMDPEDAADCLAMLDARVAVPIHYGTFWPRGVGWLRKRIFFEPGREFADHAHRLTPAVDVRLLAPGTSTTL
jgi:L-ascorbate metabolism protein UlaG (beta-lactamase superfamily)